ncbi:hypothetical protein YC2023_026896 [Brassica napus]
MNLNSSRSHLCQHRCLRVSCNNQQNKMTLNRDESLYEKQIGEYQTRPIMILSLDIYSCQCFSMKHFEKSDAATPERWFSVSLGLVMVWCACGHSIFCERVSFNCCKKESSQRCRPSLI